MFKILAFTLTAALAIGLAMRGKIRGLADLRFAWLPVVPVSLILGLLPVFANTSSAVSRLLAALANAGVLAFLVVNLRRFDGAVRGGLLVLLSGWVLNAAAIVTNGGMPLSLWAYRHAGLAGPIDEGEGGFFKIVIADSDSVLRPLGDAIPVRLINQVISIGDILLVAGIGVIVVAAMRRAGRRA